MKEDREPSELNSSLASLSRRYRPALISFFLRRVHNHADAEDLTHDVLLRVAAAGDRDTIARPDAYVFRTAANILNDRFRHDRVRDQAGARAWAADSIDESQAPERILTGRESLAQVLTALDELTPRTRSIFILYRIENLSRREIGELLGLSISAVEKNILRATLHLHDRLMSGDAK